MALYLYSIRYIIWHCTSTLSDTSYGTVPLLYQIHHMALYLYSIRYIIWHCTSTLSDTPYGTVPLLYQIHYMAMYLYSLIISMWCISADFDGSQSTTREVQGDAAGIDVSTVSIKRTSSSTCGVDVCRSFTNEPTDNINVMNSTVYKDST